MTKYFVRNLPSNLVSKLGDYIIAFEKESGQWVQGIKRAELFNCTCIEHDLYILSDEKVRIGDYFLFETKVFKCLMEGNLSLKTNANTDTPWVDREKCKKIIASTDSSLNLQSPSNSFIKQWCESGGTIDKVTVTYGPYETLWLIDETSGPTKHRCMNCGIIYDRRYLHCTCQGNIHITPIE